MKKGPALASHYSLFATHIRSGSLVPIHLIAALVHLLCLEAQCRDRPGIETRDPDRITRLFAVAISAVFDPLQCRIDLADQLALPVTRPKLESTIALGRRPVRHVGMVLAFFLQVLERLATFAKDIFLPGLEFSPEVLPLPRVHKGFVFSRPVFSLSNCASNHMDSTHHPRVAGLIVGRKPLGQLCRLP